MTDQTLYKSIKNYPNLYCTAEIWLETFGEQSDPAVLLNMGNSCDAFHWPGSFCKALSAKGFYVIRFDQRDTGLSTWLDWEKSPYTLMDMVQDIAGLLDELKIGKAHMVGYSTGGLIAQLFAIHRKEQILSLSLLMTSSDLTIKNDAFSGKDVSKKGLPPPKMEFIRDILTLLKRSQSNIEEKVHFLVESFRLANGKAAPFDEGYYRSLFEASLKRVEGRLRKGGHESNHALATSATPLISAKEFKRIEVPTLVIEGDQDPIFPPPHGRVLADAIPGAKLMTIHGMGHTLNPVYFDRIVGALAKHMFQ